MNPVRRIETTVETHAPRPGDFHTRNPAPPGAELITPGTAAPGDPRSRRLFDIAVASAAAILLAPLVLLIAAGVRLSVGSPVLFRQERTGRNGETFTIMKFRTMRRGAGSDADRLTPFGRLLRASSLDEIPQLLNVLRGEMSLVGPRPLLPEYLPRYSKRHARRHDVRPGITGWSAVKGRNSLSWEEQFECDLWYIDNRSFTLDLRILVMTVWKVLARQGVNQPGEATRERFRGT